MSTVALDWMLRRDRIVAMATIGIVALLAWAYLLAGAGMDHVMEPAPWTVGYFVLMFAMWAAMMVAMMLPSAAPTILLFATISRRRHPEAASRRLIGLFAAGYIAVWIGFSALATILQWVLQRLDLLSSNMGSASITLSALILIAAGMYQLTPLKQSCLRFCRSPLEALTEHWREGPKGALLMGMHHGLFCVGCCWMLMALLFVVGLMNLVWIAALALYVLAEKTVPAGSLTSKVLGAALVAWGAAMLTTAVT